MQIEFTKKEFRRLLDMVYIGNWILNSTRGDDRFADYDNLESKLFALCRQNGMDALVERWHGRTSRPRRFPTAASTKRSWTMRTPSSTRSSPRSWRGATWTISRSPARTTTSWSPEWTITSPNLKLTGQITSASPAWTKNEPPKKPPFGGFFRNRRILCEEQTAK